MFVTELEVVNECLATMGEAPLNTLEDDHSYKAAALSALTTTNRIEQKRGWWFNSEYVELVPDAISSYIYLPLDALAIKVLDRGSTQFAQRGRRLYDTKNSRWTWDAPVWVDVVRYLSFDDLPFHAADVVGYGAIMRFQRAFDGDNTRYSQYAQDYSRARAELVAENVRNKRPNLLATIGHTHKMGLVGGFGPSATRLPWTPGYPR